MTSLVLAVLCTAALVWGLRRVDSDSLLRPLLIGALLGSITWVMWALVSMAPSGSTVGMQVPKAVKDADALPGFWQKLAKPGLSAMRLCLALLVLSMLLAAWPPAGMLGRVMRLVAIHLLLVFSILVGVVLAFVVFWSTPAHSGMWQHEVVLTVLSIILLCIANARQNIEDTLPPIVG